jgi:hypothetical protein
LAFGRTHYDNNTWVAQASQIADASVLERCLAAEEPELLGQPFTEQQPKNNASSGTRVGDFLLILGVAAS